MRHWGEKKDTYQFKVAARLCDSLAEHIPVPSPELEAQDACGLNQTGEIPIILILNNT